MLLPEVALSVPGPDSDHVGVPVAVELASAAVSVTAAPLGVVDVALDWIVTAGGGLEPPPPPHAASTADITPAATGARHERTREDAARIWFRFKKSSPWDSTRAGLR